MWVTIKRFTGRVKLSPTLVFLSGFTHNLSHRLKALNSPLKWGYGAFPQVNGLVTTTTYNYMKTPVRFLLVNLNQFQLIKNLQSFTTAGRLSK
jgi:hypothetical protein